MSPPDAISKHQIGENGAGGLLQKHQSLVFDNLIWWAHTLEFYH
jgi:hypothetical protein